MKRLTGFDVRGLGFGCWGFGVLLPVRCHNKHCGKGGIRGKGYECEQGLNTRMLLVSHAHSHWNANGENDHCKGIAVQLLACLLVEKARVVVVVDEGRQQRHVPEVLVVRPILVIQERTYTGHGQQAAAPCAHETVA